MCSEGKSVIFVLFLFVIFCFGRGLEREGVFFLFYALPGSVCACACVCRSVFV